MTLFGLMASFVLHGGLDTPAAAAATPAERVFAAPLTVEPINVVAIQAQIDRSQAEMRVVQDRTDHAMSRLERYSGR